jgi:hypothetical protein
MRVFALLAVSGAVACGIPSNGPAMRPGEDCVDCHNSGEGPDFTAAGTLFRNATDATSDGFKGGRVHITDSNGRTLTLKTNEAGNFYTREKLTFPLQVSVEGDGLLAVMSTPVPEGGCNRCHTVPPPTTQLPDVAPGRVALVGTGTGDEFMLPGFDCQACHRAGGQAGNVPYNASGTVFVSSSGGAGAEGVTVTITDAQGRVFEAVTNRVGNFVMPQAIAFGGAARVRISHAGVTHEMDEDLPHGSCNRCHRPGGEEGRVSLEGSHDD